ncbi:MAG: aminoglycoside phosphotransferase family protein [Cyclobacteriaceae bacterium]
MIANHQIRQIVKSFQVEGGGFTVSKIGAGHIHDTYHVKNAKSTCPDYLLQKINERVFHNVDALIENSVTVISHFNQHKRSGMPDMPKIIPTVDGRFHLQSNGYWRLTEFIKESRSFDRVQNSDQAYEGGKAVGAFIKVMANLPLNRLNVIIPNFHDLKYRLAELDTALNDIPRNKLKEISTEIAFIKKYADQLLVIESMRNAGKLPIRVCHNDTKFNNILFDDSGKAVCLIDLDTVMPGLIHYDFGDAIRSCAATANEDADIEGVDIDLESFQAFSHGFMGMVDDMLIDAEREYMVLSVVLMPFIMGVRFLTDHLRGDKYFKVEYTGHNLIRTKNQLALAGKAIKLQLDLKALLNK